MKRKETFKKKEKETKKKKNRNEKKLYFLLVFK